MKLTVYLADQNPPRDRSLGISGMTRCLLQELVRHPDLELHTLTSLSSLRFQDEEVHEHRLFWSTANSLTRLFTDHLHGLRRRDGVWLYPKGYPGLAPKSDKAPIVAIMHDTILQHYADHYPGERSRANYAYWIWMTKLALHRATRILTVSETSRREIQAFAQRHKIQAPPIHVTWQGSPWETYRPAMASEKGDYVVHLASLEPHKRTAWLLGLWATAKRPLPKLKLIGKVPDTAKESLSLLDDRAEVLPYLEGEEYVDAIRRARALLLPSEIEGFGIPALEAYYVGTPVCFARTTSVEELLAPATKSGGFDLAVADTFFTTLDDLLALPTDVVHRIGNDLRERYAMEKFAQRVLDILRQCEPPP